MLAVICAWMVSTSQCSNQCNKMLAKTKIIVNSQLGVEVVPNAVGDLQLFIYDQGGNVVNQ